MLETLTLITLSVLFLIFFRPGKTPPLDSPLNIERPGQYQMTLAPQINLAQPFIEAVAAHLSSLKDIAQNSATQFFEVRDKQVTAHGHDCYLLAITLRDGLLYFQAVGPQFNSRDEYLRAISEFADAKLAHIPATPPPDRTLDEHIVAAVQEVSQFRGINIRQL